MRDIKSGYESENTSLRNIDLGNTALNNIVLKNTVQGNTAHKKTYNSNHKPIVYYHLPGLFEFYELYRRFLPLYREHREYFYDWCDIGSIYGAPGDCLWGGGRVGYGDCAAEDVLSLMCEYRISARLTFSNSLLEPEHLKDRRCNELCRLFEKKTGNASGDTFDEACASAKTVKNGIIIYSDILLDYLKNEYPGFYFVSSTTKVITDFEQLKQELDRDDFRYVVPDFRLNKSFDRLRILNTAQKNKVEFLCNECCSFCCQNRRECYEAVSRMALGMKDAGHYCKSPDSKGGYKFSKAMKNPGFIGVCDIKDIYMPMGFTNFKIEGRSLGSALVLEFLLYYMTKPEYQLNVREEIYLDNMLDLF